MSNTNQNGTDRVNDFLIDYLAQLPEPECKGCGAALDDEDQQCGRCKQLEVNPTRYPIRIEVTDDAT